jgi:UDP-glucose 4-epimerase
VPTFLVTGGAGFIGSHLCDRLLAEGSRVVAVDDLSTGHVGNLAQARAYGQRFTFYSVDIGAEGLGALFVRYQPEVVYHLAACRPKSPEAVTEARTGVLGLLAVLQASVACGARKVVFASSASVYGESRAGYPLKETVLAGARPLDPGAISKKLAEDYLRFFAATRDLDFASVVLSNVYGPRQYPVDGFGVVAAFAGAALSGRQAVVFGDGSQTRDLLFVDDAVNALALAADRGSGKTVNVGTGVETAVSGLYRMVAGITGHRGEPRFGPLPPGDRARSALDASRAAVELGWKPWTHLEDGLRETVAYLRSN